MRVAAVKPWHVLAVGLFGAIAIGAQAPPAPVRLTATTQNVSGAGEAIKITISSCAAQCNAPEINCIVFIGTRQGGRDGYSLRCVPDPACRSVPG